MFVRNLADKAICVALGRTFGRSNVADVRAEPRRQRACLRGTFGNVAGASECTCLKRPSEWTCMFVRNLADKWMCVALGRTFGRSDVADVCMSETAVGMGHVCSCGTSYTKGVLEAIPHDPRSRVLTHEAQRNESSA